MEVGLEPSCFWGQRAWLSIELFTLGGTVRLSEEMLKRRKVEWHAFQEGKREITLHVAFLVMGSHYPTLQQVVLIRGQSPFKFERGVGVRLLRILNCQLTIHSKRKLAEHHLYVRHNTRCFLVYTQDTWYCGGRDWWL